MDLNFEFINWIAVITCIVAGQIILTIWFVTIFGAQWAKEFGVEDKKQHSKEIPGYTYVVQIVCTTLLVIGIAMLQSLVSVDTIWEGIVLGFWVAVSFGVTTSLPGYAFLKRWKAFFLSIGSQTVLILVVSMILAIWK